jgi:predicted DNA-binding transcriptional regulator AlpA
MKKGGRILARKGSLLKDYYTKKELAKALGFSITAINRWQAAGTGPPSILLGGIRLYPKDGVPEWIEQASKVTKGAAKTGKKPVARKVPKKKAVKPKKKTTK